MADRPPPRGTAKRKKKRPPPVYVEARYPFWLGIGSFAWALIGWMIAAMAPHLAFFPLIGVLHYLLPTVTIGLIAANLYFAVRDLWRGAHPLGLLLVTGLQVGLFTTLFFQLFAHLGAELFDIHGPTYPWQWVGFSLAHAFRASDVLDIVEAYGLRIQPIKHTSALVAIFVIGYHVVIDVFFLGVLWGIVAGIRRRLFEDEGIRALTRKAIIIAFVIWLLVWLVVAFYVHRWNPIDIPLWFVENILRVVDFADIMESFNIRLHELPREGMTGTLTFLCRVWIAIAIALVLGEKKKSADRRLATPPEVNPAGYWSRRVGILAAMLVAVLTTGILGYAVLGNPIPKLTAAVAGTSEGQSRAALRALRRMGPAAADAVPSLVEARATVSPAIRDEATKTLGFLGTQAIEPLTEIALREQPEPAVVAVRALGQVGPESAPGLVKIWTATAEPVREQAADELRGLGSDAVPFLMETTTTENADVRYHWFGELDRNWRLRSSEKQIVWSLQKLPDLLKLLDNNPDAEATVTILTEMRGCGSAARVATATVIDHLQDKDGRVQTEAASLLRSIGPPATPALLRRLDNPNPAVVSSVLGILSDAGMWDERALKDEAAIPALTKLLGGQDRAGRDIAIRGLGLAGPAAKGAIPELVALLGDPDDDRRKVVRETITRIDTDWKKHPQLSRAIPALLPWLTRLPKDESEELFACLGELPSSEVDRLLWVLTNLPVRRWDPSAPRLKPDERKRQEQAHVEAAFAALIRLGPRVKSAVPALTRYVADRNSDFGMRHRIVRSLKHLTTDMEPLIPVVIGFLGYGQGAIDFLVDAGPKAAVPYLGELLADKDADRRRFAIGAIASFGADAKSVLPKVVERLKDPDFAVRVKDRTVSARALVVETLEAIDKDWARHPASAKVLSAIVANFQKEGRESRQRFVELLGKLGAAAQPVVPDMVGLMLSKDGSFDENTHKALDRIDSRWREHPAVKPIIPQLIKRLDQSFIAYRPLIALGTAAVPELEKALESGNVQVQDAVIDVLKMMGEAGKQAIPAIAKKLTDSRRSWESVKRVLAALRAIDPKWASDPRLKETIPQLLRDVVGQPNAGMRYVSICAAIGPGAVPELVKQLGSAKAEQRQLTLAALRDIGVDAKEAVPAIEKALKDTDARVRQGAVQALGQIGKGNKDLVAVLAPVLIDPDYEVRRYVTGSLDLVDRDWRKSPKFKQPLKQILSALSNRDAKVRLVVLRTIEDIGPVEGVIPTLQKLAKVEKDQRLKRYIEGLLAKFREKK